MHYRFVKHVLSTTACSDELSLDKIQQFFINVEKEEWKFAAVTDLYDTLIITQTVIFCNSRRKVDWLAEKMREANFTVSCIHAGMVQTERNRVFKQFLDVERYERTFPRLIISA
jgi:ATP-dependent RNA helicase